MLIDESGDIKVNVNNSNLTWRPSVIAVASFVAALGASGAKAQQLTEEGTPLSVVLEHKITRDSNVSRLSEENAATDNTYDTVNTTGLRFGLDKPYGRQVYKLSARVARTSYAKLDRYNNNSSNIDGSFSTEIASNWKLTATGLTQESLAPFEENSASRRLVRNIKNYKEGSLSLQYGVAGRWALSGNYQGNRLSYSEEDYKVNDADQSTGGLRLYYYSTDLLYYGVGVRNVETEYPKRANLIRTDKNFDMYVVWQVTGLSNLNARVTRRQTGYNNTAVTKSSGWGGALSWDYRPEGLLIYNVELARNTSADRQKTFAIVGGGDMFNLTDSIATSLDARVTMLATAKVRFGVNYELTRFEQDDDVSQVIPGLSTQGGKSSSYYRALGLSMNYQVLRPLALGCSISKYKQTEQRNEVSTLVRPKYDGNAVSCNASFTLNI
jgi:hypothetical protein